MGITEIKKLADLSEEQSSAQKRLDDIWAKHELGLSRKIVSEFETFMRQEGFTVTPDPKGVSEAKYKTATIRLITPQPGEKWVGVFMRVTIERTLSGNTATHAVLAIRKRPEQATQKCGLVSMTSGADALLSQIERTNAEIASFNQFEVVFATIQNAQKNNSGRGNEQYASFTEALKSLLA
jgi:hypothetical protein